MREEVLRLINTDKKTVKDKKHRQEIIRWANSPEGTKVWVKRKGDKNWLLQKSPSWLPDNKHIVDDSASIERMKEMNNV